LTEVFVAGGPGVLPGGPTVPRRISAGVPTINDRWLCHSGE